MPKDIEIKESIFDDNSLFNVKRFKFGNLDIERPIKVLDSKSLTIDLLNEYKKEFDNIVIERSKSIRLKSLKKILNESDDKQIKRLFSIRNWQLNYPFILSLTFNFNPFNEFQSISNISGYLDYYYNFSNPILLIPNIKIERYDSEKKCKEKIIKFDHYLKFIDEVYEIFSFRNNKPIFVPISLRLGINQIKKIVRESIKKERFNFWLDFEGSSLTKPKISRARAILRELEDLERINDTILYSTNIRREIISHVDDPKTPASSVLLPLTGSNIIGVNKEPPRIIRKTISNEEKARLREHKARVFNPDTYYFLKVNLSDYSNIQKKKLMERKNNNLFNSNLIDREFKTQSNFFLDNLSINNYILRKSMIQEFKKGALKSELFDFQKKMDNWF
jgi:hypothetical protein